MPNLTLINIINYPNNYLHISDFKGKAIILDFWATYCTTCLAHFPLADSLQHEHNNELQILLIDNSYHNDNELKIAKTLKRFNSGNQKFSLPSAFADTLLDKLFPHYTIPHYVWINKYGIIKAITGSDEVTREMVNSFIKTDQVPEYEKTDFDPQRPLYTVKDLPLDYLEQFSIFLRGKIEGIGNGGRRTINDTTRGVILHNRSLLDMYRRILSELIKGVSDNRLLIEVKQPSKLSYIPSASEKEIDWKRNNLYSYELIVPKAQMDHLFDYALDDLNKYTPFYARVEKRKEFCWTLEREGNKDLLFSRGSEEIQGLDDPMQSKLINSSMMNLIIYLNKISNNAIIIDQTGYTQNIDVKFKTGVSDMGTMSKYLKAYGLKLTSGYKEIDMLVVSDK